MSTITLIDNLRINKCDYKATSAGKLVIKPEENGDAKEHEESIGLWNDQSKKL